VPVSLGGPKTPTFAGTKVIMSKQPSVRLKGPGYDEVVPYALRLTYSGEYLIGSPAAYAHVMKRVDASNGCTDLVKADAERIYGLLKVGDPVVYVNSTAPSMSFTNGFGDWNVPWAEWVKGGDLPTA
jgi:lipoprotein-anchoring transpeptidase ErfK/SrfK